MSFLTVDDVWGSAVVKLTALPNELAKYDSINFIRSTAFRKNGERLFMRQVRPLLVANGGQWEIVSGFIDKGVASEAGIEPDELKAQFRRVRLINPEGQMVDLVLSEES